MIKQYGSEVMKIEPDVFLSKKNNVDKWLKQSERSLKSIKDSRIDTMHDLLQKSHQEILEMIETVEVEKRIETDNKFAIRQAEYDRMLKNHNWHTTSATGVRHTTKESSYWQFLPRQNCKTITNHFITSDESDLPGKKFGILFETKTTILGRDLNNRINKSIDIIDSAIYLSLFDTKPCKGSYGENAFFTDAVPFIEKGKWKQVADAKVAMKIVKLIEKFRKSESYYSREFMKHIDLEEPSESHVKDMMISMNILS